VKQMLAFMDGKMIGQDADRNGNILRERDVLLIVPCLNGCHCSL